jgi:hypothetical protein
MVVTGATERERVSIWNSEPLEIYFAIMIEKKQDK